MSDVDKSVSGVVLVDLKDGHTVFELKAGGAACATATLTAGNYDAKITRAASGDAASVPVFFHEGSMLGTISPQCDAGDADPDVGVGTTEDLWQFNVGTKAIHAWPRLRIEDGTDYFYKEQGFKISRAWNGERALNANDGAAIGLVPIEYSRTIRVDRKGAGEEFPFQFRSVSDGAKWTFRT